MDPAESIAAHRNVSSTVDHFFRIQSGKMISVLTKLLGRSHWETCEEIVQETLLKAFQVWSMHGYPENPAGWLMSVAKNKAIDIIRKQRREKNYTEKTGREILETVASNVEVQFTESQIRDGQLRMLFACCDVRLAAGDRVALTLKMLCGLSHSEIAIALISPEETIRKRIYRARETLKLEGFYPEELTEKDIPTRIESVLEVLYLMFNEGYKTSSPLSYIRFELCEEALRLAFELEKTVRESATVVSALIALMFFQMARFPTRTYSDGSICQLQFQDRSQWNADYLSRGFLYFRRSAQGSQLSRYHIEAAIASHHCAAASFEKTDWKSIEFLYDRLTNVYPSPIVELNRAIAIGFARGPRIALDELERLSRYEELAEYYLYHASFGEFYAQEGQFEKAAHSYATAHELCTSELERRFLLQKKSDCEKKI